MKALQILKIILGFIALALGMIGAVLPVWPTTPFVLLALGLFASSPAIQQKILRIRFFREYYESYKHGKGLRKKTVIISLSFLWAMLTLSAALTGRLWITLLLLAVGAAVSIHILYISKPKQKTT